MGQGEAEVEGMNGVVGILMERREYMILILIVKRTWSGNGDGYLVVVVDFASWSRYGGVVNVPWPGFYYGC